METNGKRGRPRAFDADTVAERAMQLFWQKGYEATSMAELLEAMGIGRSSFYQSFGSKQDVFLLAVQRYRDQLVARLRRSLDEASSGWEFIEATLASVGDGTLTGSGRRGCLVFNAAAELNPGNDEIGARVRAAIEAFTVVFTDAARRARREGDLSSNRDPSLVGRQAVMAMSGLQTLAKAGVDSGELVALAKATAAGMRA
jgi:TetR/AcrR family transcriptional repressor of nem operon